MELGQVRQYILLLTQGSVSLYFIVMVLRMVCCACFEEKRVRDWVVLFVLVSNV
jgi:hypothetical protein